MRREATTAAIAIVVLTVLLGLVYPLLTIAVGQVLFPTKANGSLVRIDGRVVGSKLIGLQFGQIVLSPGGRPKLDKNGNPVTSPDPRFFQTRPSATTPPDNAAATTFSNLGPNDVATERAIAANIQGYLQLEGPFVPGLTAERVPVDAANTSASGVDPDISQANAAIQAHRIAAVRHLPLARVMALIARSTDGRTLGIFGEPGVNVLSLNLALDRVTKGR
jgi:K+-transporting ATPase ATPase C chain